MKVFFLISVLLLNIAYSKAQTNIENKKTNKAIILPVRTKINPSKLLQPIKENIEKDFAGAKILSAYRHETKGFVTYSVHIMSNVTKWSLIYDSKGKYIKKEEIKFPHPSIPPPPK